MKNNQDNQENKVLDNANKYKEDKKQSYTDIAVAKIKQIYDICRMVQDSKTPKGKQTSKINNNMFKTLFSTGLVREGFMRVIYNMLVEANVSKPAIMYGYGYIHDGVLQIRVLYGHPDFPDGSLASFPLHTVSMLIYQNVDDFVATCSYLEFLIEQGKATKAMKEIQKENLKIKQEIMSITKPMNFDGKVDALKEISAKGFATKYGVNFTEDHVKQLNEFLDKARDEVKADKTIINEDEKIDVMIAKLNEFEKTILQPAVMEDNNMELLSDEDIEQSEKKIDDEIENAGGNDGQGETENKS